MTNEEIENLIREKVTGQARLKELLTTDGALEDAVTDLAFELVAIAYEEAAQTVEKEIGSSRREIAAAIRELKSSLDG